MRGPRFFASIKLLCDKPLPVAIAPASHGQRFCGALDFQQMPVLLDVPRNEGSIRFGWNSVTPNDFPLMTGDEPVGRGDGVRAD